MFITRKKVVLILGEDPTQGLNDTALTAKKKYSINVGKSIRLKLSKIVLNLLYNGANSCLFVNSTEIHKFNARDSRIFLQII